MTPYVSNSSQTSRQEPRRKIDFSAKKSIHRAVRNGEPSKNRITAVRPSPMPNAIHSTDDAPQRPGWRSEDGRFVATLELSNMEDRVTWVGIAEATGEKVLIRMVPSRLLPDDLAKRLVEEQARVESRQDSAKPLGHRI